MRLIDADTVVTIQTYDDMYEEWGTKTMTVAEALDEFSDEGCPPTADAEIIMYAAWKGTVCGRCGHDLSGWAEDAGRLTERGLLHYCPICGARMIGGQDGKR